MKLRLEKFIDYRQGTRLDTVWDGDLYIGYIEARRHRGKISEVYRLGVEADLRGKGYERRIVDEIVADPTAVTNTVINEDWYGKNTEAKS